MERDPKEVRKRNYYKNLNVRVFKPLFFWHSCECCGHEYRREPMYECAEPSLIFTWTHYFRGCMNCFSSKEHFLQWLMEEGYVLDDKAFENLTVKDLYQH